MDGIEEALERFLFQAKNLHLPLCFTIIERKFTVFGGTR